MTHVMCSPWKRIFTLTPLVPLTMLSPISHPNNISTYGKTMIMNTKIQNQMLTNLFTQKHII
jgi:hypothetical protein